MTAGDKPLQEFIYHRKTSKQQQCQQSYCPASLTTAQMGERSKRQKRKYRVFKKMSDFVFRQKPDFRRFQVGNAGDRQNCRRVQNRGQVVS